MQGRPTPHPHLLAVAACLQVLQEPLQLLRRGAESQGTDGGAQPIRRLKSASSRQGAVASRHHVTGDGQQRRGNGCRRGACNSRGGDVLPVGCQSRGKAGLLLLPIGEDAGLVLCQLHTWRASGTASLWVHQLMRCRAL